MRYVIVHPEHGIFIGLAGTSVVFSLMDSAGQAYASTFPSKSSARWFVSQWCTHNDPNEYYYKEVTVKDNSLPIVSAIDLRSAGLAKYLGDMELNMLRHEDVAGNA